MAGIIIGLAVAVYTGYLIYRQVKNAREGNFCGNCSGCPSAKNCEQLEL
ncbi:MAG TPA: FeoB-associated Cys-rich membrane protein [Clostridiales bacterium]|nr:FeoB-associated Cys-rich membrane protein [Clostridiales bacterium]